MKHTLIRLFLPLTLTLGACNSGAGSTEPANLEPGVDLSGTWSLDMTPRSLGGPECGILEVNVPVPGVTVIAYNPDTGALTLDADDPAASITATMTGTTFTYEETVTEPGTGVVTTSSIDLTFTVDGSNAFGRGREFAVDANGELVCDIAFDLSGKPSAGELTFLLEWGTTDDIDLEAREPDGENIYWGNQSSVPSGGLHSGDANKQCNRNMIATEQIRYETPQAGVFTANVYVSFWNSCNAGPVQFALTTIEPGEVPEVMLGVVSRNNDVPHQVFIQP